MNSVSRSAAAACTSSSRGRRRLRCGGKRDAQEELCGRPAELTHQSPRRGANQLRHGSHREAVAWAHCGRRNWSCRPWVRANTGLSTRCTACAPASTSTPPWLQPRMPTSRRRSPHQRSPSFATCDRLCRSLAPTTATWRERGGNHRAPRGLPNPGTIGDTRRYLHYAIYMFAPTNPKPDQLG